MADDRVTCRQARQGYHVFGDFKMQDIRCGTCSRKLGEGEFITLTMKCPRCKTMNYLRATRPEPDCHRATRTESAYGRHTESSTSKERLSIP